MSITLTNIQKAAKKNSACVTQYRPFCRAIAKKDKILAWQIVLGNKTWLTARHIKLPKNLESLAQGIGITYHLSGVIDTIKRYNNGVLHGEMLIYNDNGRLIERKNYINGNLHGFSYTYKSSNGVLLSKYRYENGFLHGISEVYHDNGIIANRAYYKRSSLYGLYETFDNLGNLTHRYTYHNGYKTGPYELFKRKEKDRYYIAGECANSQEHGIQNVYNSDGILIESSKWNHGVFVKSML